MFWVCLLAMCVMSALALSRVKGRHACWHRSLWKGASDGVSTGKAEGKMVPAPGAEAPPRSNNADHLSTASCDDITPPIDDFPSERRPSFVVRKPTPVGVQPAKGREARLLFPTRYLSVSWTLAGFERTKTHQLTKVKVHPSRGEAPRHRVCSSL